MHLQRCSAASPEETREHRDEIVTSRHKEGTAGQAATRPNKESASAMKRRGTRGYAHGHHQQLPRTLNEKSTPALTIGMFSTTDAACALSQVNAPQPNWFTQPTKHLHIGAYRKIHAIGHGHKSHGYRPRTSHASRSPTDTTYSQNHNAKPRPKLHATNVPQQPKGDCFTPPRDIITYRFNSRKKMHCIRDEDVLISYAE